MVTTQPTQPIDLLTVTEAAREIGTSRGAIHHHRLTGRLPAIAVNQRYLIPRESVEELRHYRETWLGHKETPER